ncbi:hypothetical protein EWM64_g1019 [Hericium alpestre]|uniref:Citrate transporter-like domain-containing protein n=1 Tax=Hericium alpestre TaxID=135208 RepID=A0A4Z0A9H8_9AGAM|nr:hypothetical protein EWM64_g1019 [Hericium alpestre]
MAAAITHVDTQLQAYMSVSLDATGLFRFLAYRVARKGGSSGQRLYLYIYLFFLVSGVLIGNDPVILSGTTFLAYLTRMSGITPPTAWIFAQFTAANMASAVLVSSNVTNLVLTGAFGISFITYTSSLILPFLAAAVLTYPFLVLVLYGSSELIPSSIELPTDDDNAERTGVSINNPRAALIDARGAVFGTTLLLITLGVLVGTSTIGVPVWEVTVPPALVMLCRDVWHDWMRYRTSRMQQTDEGGNEKTSGNQEQRSVDAEMPSGPQGEDSARDGSRQHDVDDRQPWQTDHSALKLLFSSPAYAVFYVNIK